MVLCGPRGRKPHVKAGGGGDPTRGRPAAGQVGEGPPDAWVRARTTCPSTTAVNRQRRRTPAAYRRFLTIQEEEDVCIVARARGIDAAGGARCGGRRRGRLVVSWEHDGTGE